MRLAGLLLLALLAAAAAIYYSVTVNARLEADFAGAQARLEQGFYDRALDGFRDIYEEHPDFRLAPAALYSAAEVRETYQKSYQEAILMYLLVVRDYPQSEEALLAQRRVAEIYKNRLRDYGRAIVAYQKLLNREVPDADQIQYRVADSYFRLNNFEQARIEFESLRKSFPQSPLLPEVQYRIAVAYSLEGDGAEAEKAFRTVIETWPDDAFAAEASFGLATDLEERGELRAALKILEGLEGVYAKPEALAKKTEQVRERIRKKKKAI